MTRKTSSILANIALCATVAACSTATKTTTVSSSNLSSGQGYPSSHGKFFVEPYTTVPVYARNTWFYRHSIGVPAISFTTGNNTQCFMLPKGTITCTSQHLTAHGCTPNTIKVPAFDYKTDTGSSSKAVVSFFPHQQCLPVAPISDEVIALPVGRKIAFNGGSCATVILERKPDNVIVNKWDETTKLVCENAAHGFAMDNHSIDTW